MNPMNLQLPHIPLHCETKRQLLYVLVGMVLATLIYLKIFGPTIMITLLVIGFFLSCLAQRRRLPLISWLLDEMERPEKKVLPGSAKLHYLAGCTLVLILFPKNIALASIMVLAWGDSLRRIGGKYLGRIPHHLNNKKLIEGTLIGIFLGGLSASYFVHYIPAFLSAGVAMLAEVIEIKIWKITIDDNLLVPLIAGTVMWAILVL